MGSTLDATEATLGDVKMARKWVRASAARMNKAA